MPRPKKVAVVQAGTVTPDAQETKTPAVATRTVYAGSLEGVARSDMPRLLAAAKAAGDAPLIAAILEACRH